MPSLVDANVILPLLLDGHPHRAVASAWWDKQPDESVIFTLPVRMAVLRLLSNTHVMGTGVLAPEDAWQALAELTSDARAVVRDHVPSGLDSLWLMAVRGRRPTPNLWTDAWLAAHAEAEALTLVTFDKGLKSFRPPRLILLHG